MIFCEGLTRIYGKLEMQSKSLCYVLALGFLPTADKHPTVPPNLNKTPFLSPYTTCPFLLREPTLPHVFALL